MSELWNKVFMVIANSKSSNTHKTDEVMRAILSELPNGMPLDDSASLDYIKEKLGLVLFEKKLC